MYRLTETLPLLLASSAIFVSGDVTTLPNLPLGEINVVINTDTHSWVGGHGEKESFDVDYGDVVSFFQLLKGQIEALEASDPENHKHDLFFVMNGDWIDGTGLALNGNPSYLVPILEKMPWDAVNIGNHELYKREVIEYVERPGGLAEWWDEKFLSSNIVMTDTQNPLGNLYHYIRGKHHTVLVFGFLYDMTRNDPVVTVKRVEDTVQESWFDVALRGESYDAILVLAHMDHKDPLVQVILNRIRQTVGSDMPVQFVTGHTHYRGQSNPDNTSCSFEAGRYLDTVGFVSFPSQTKMQQVIAANQAAAAAAEAAAAAAATANSTATTANGTATNSTDSGDGSPEEEIPQQVELTDLFQHVFLDAKYETLANALNLEFLATQEGMELSAFVSAIQSDLGLYKIVGCIEHDHLLNKSLDDTHSLWGLFCDRVVPRIFRREEDSAVNTGNPVVPMFGKGSWRYDLLQGELIMDEIIAVAPFNDSLVVFPNVPGSVMVQANAALNSGGKGGWLVDIPSWVMCPSPDSFLPQPEDPEGANTLYDLMTTEFAVDGVRMALQTVWPNASQVPEPVTFPNHTSTSLWLEFFDKTDLCQTENKGTHKDPKPKKHDKQPPPKNTAPPPSTTPTDQNQTDTSGNKFFGTITAFDKFRIDFVWVAVGVVVVFFAIYVHQRGRIWRSQVREQEALTQEALDEYRDQNEPGWRYSDDPSDEFPADENNNLHEGDGDGIFQIDSGSMELGTGINDSGDEDQGLELL